MAASAVLSIFHIISLFLPARAENACNTSSGFSPSSCSSYFYCDDGGEEQEAQCWEGLLWSKDLQACDQEQNVSCGKGLFWFFRRGSAFLKVGLQLASIAHRVTTKLVGPLIGNGTGDEKDDADEKDEEVLQEKFSIENNGNIQQREIENILKVTVNAGIRPLQEYEGSGSLLNTDDTENEDDYEGESDITDDKSVNTAKENYSEEDKISITNFVIKKVAVIEPLEVTLPMFTRSRSLKQQTLPKYGENLAENIQENQDMKTLGNEQVDKSTVLSITPMQLTPTTTDSILQSKIEEDRSKAVSYSNFIS